MNELLLLAKILAECAFVLFASRLGKHWLVLTVAVNLILVSIMGAKVVTFFGFETNAGNTYYAGVFLAIQLLLERYGKGESWRAVWMGLGAIVFFMVMARFAVYQMTPTYLSQGASDAIRMLFGFIPRIAIASIIAFVAAQFINITLYDALHKKTGQHWLWLRSVAATVSGQAVDSVLFFSIAFLGVLPVGALIGVMLTGFVVKVLIGIVGIAFLYLNRFNISNLA